MFEEWLEGFQVDGHEFSDDEVFLLREAYKLGLNRAYGCGFDSVLKTEVDKELAELNKDDE